jgi:hypothetical protein
MRTRPGVLAAAGIAALALSGNAFASYAPRLVVDPATPVIRGAGAVTVSLAQAAGDQSTAAVTIYAPRGYRAALGKAPGEVVGTAAATGIVRGSTGPPLKLTGRIFAGAPANYASSMCAPGPHRAVWLVALNGSGRSLIVPVYVDPVTQGPEAAFAALKLQLCLDSPDAPAVPPAEPSPGLITLDLRFAASIWTNPTTTGTLVWRAFLTPYAAGTATADPAATVESRALLRQPTQLTLLGRLAARSTIVLYGRLLAGARQIANASVTLFAGRTAKSQTAVASAKTTSAGTYSFSRKLRRTSVFRTRVDIPVRDATATGCAAASTAPAGCVTATLQPFHVLSSTAVKVIVLK